jgi:predicted nucleic acid-binding protein
MAGEPVFLDTSLIVAASVDAHPSNLSAVVFVNALVADAAPLCISSQVCREFLVVLTRKPVSGRSFALAEGLAALETWRSACTLLDETPQSLAEWLRLASRYQVHGKQLHDRNVVAVMNAHGVRRLATRNAADFERYRDEIEIESVI